ncbi:ORF25b [Fowl aviadenovirus E]|uniref:ORF25b n=1 Tax=Fowl aviadenovirus E TaxID=190065 RepID=A0A1B2TSM6_9ADEN|nr:ORF25b [Fowl aviadenovirus E]
MPLPSDGQRHTSTPRLGRQLLLRVRIRRTPTFSFRARRRLLRNRGSRKLLTPIRSHHALRRLAGRGLLVRGEQRGLRTHTLEPQREYVRGYSGTSSRLAIAVHYSPCGHARHRTESRKPRILQQGSHLPYRHGRYRSRNSHTHCPRHRSLPYKG